MLNAEPKTGELEFCPLLCDLGLIKREAACRMPSSTETKYGQARRQWLRAAVRHFPERDEMNVGGAFWRVCAKDGKVVPSLKKETHGHHFLQVMMRQYVAVSHSHP